MTAGHAQGGTPTTPAAPVTPPDATARIADTLAALADTLSGWRDRFDTVIAKEEQEAADTAERNRQREPAEWQAALDTFRQWLTRHVHGDNPMTDEARAKADEVIEGIVTALDDDLRAGSAGYSLRYALECLSGPNPPVSLADMAAQRAHSQATPEARDLYARAWLDGATREETG